MIVPRRLKIIAFSFLAAYGVVLFGAGFAAGWVAF